MKEISSKEIIMPLVIVMVAVIVVSVFSVSFMKNIRDQAQATQLELDACQNVLGEKERFLGSALERLNITEQDVAKYDELYEEKETQAEVLLEQLVEEQNKPPERVIEACQIPYRSVPTYEAFGKAARLELLIERLDTTEEYMKSFQFLHEDELRHIAGQLYFVSSDFKDLFFTRGVKLALDEEGQEWYLQNSEHLEELEGIYNNFVQFTSDKLRKRLPQIMKSQKAAIRGMQGRYFM